MTDLLEAVPNFSEGRRPEVIAALTAAARSVPGVRLLDIHSDVDHNRTVLTLAGSSQPLQEALYRTAAQAAEQIDLRQHRGAHPRVGATDVVPFIPLADTPMATAIEAARSLGARVAETLHIPVYFYEEAATRPERRNLANLRRGEFEGLRQLIASSAERAPDLGPRQLHPSAGAVIIGARLPLIAYNMYLNTTDLAVARAIARAVRHSSGGLRYVKALGLAIPARNQVQVSMNLTDYRQTAIHTVFNLVQSEAAAYGLTVTASELVGLIPLGAVVDAARYYLRLRDFDESQILEMKLMQAGMLE